MTLDWTVRLDCFISEILKHKNIKTLNVLLVLYEGQIWTLSLTGEQELKVSDSKILAGKFTQLKTMRLYFSCFLESFHASPLYPFRPRCTLSHRQVVLDFGGNIGWGGGGGGERKLLRHNNWFAESCKLALSVMTQNVLFVDPWEGSCSRNVYKWVKWVSEGQPACGHTVLSGPCQIYARSRQFVALIAVPN